MTSLHEQIYQLNYLSMVLNILSYQYQPNWSTL